MLQIRGDSRQVVVGEAENLYSRTLLARSVNLISTDNLKEPMRVGVKIRHRHEPASATIETSGENVQVTFDEPQRAITPGQAAVFYERDMVVGGGWIS